jgi:hypothetical protein
MDTMRDTNKKLNMNINQKMLKIESLTADLRVTKRQECDLSSHLYVLTEQIDKCLDIKIDVQKLRKAKNFMVQRVLKTEIPNDYNSLKAIEKIRDDLAVSLKQQLQEEAKKQQLQEEEAENSTNAHN